MKSEAAKEPRPSSLREPTVDIVVGKQPLSGPSNGIESVRPLGSDRNRSTTGGDSHAFFRPVETGKSVLIEKRNQ
jgi:hypothetical protein